MRMFAIAGAFGLGLASMTAAQAAPLSFVGTTTPLMHNVTIDLYDGSTTFGKVAATGFNMNDGSMDFIAWCFDLDHSITPGQSYDYISTASPFSSSTLAAGATTRAQSVFDANFATVDVFDIVQAAAFQLALWEVAYDSDFDITTGVFQASGFGANALAIASTATTFLEDAFGYAGAKKFNLDFLQDNSRNAGLYPQLPSDQTFQNLVTAAPVPLPAAGPLMFGAIGATMMIRRRKAKAAA